MLSVVVSFSSANITPVEKSAAVANTSAEVDKFFVVVNFLNRCMCLLGFGVALVFSTLTLDAEYSNLLQVLNNKPISFFSAE